jgi:microcystin-dependent protein
MTPAFVGSIFIFAGNFQIYGWQYCAGQLIAISNNETLYTLLGTTYGGDGVSTFALPDLRGRVAINQGTGLGLSTYNIGQIAGTENVTVTSNNMPSHTHLINANSGSGTTGTPANNTLLAASYDGTTAEKFYNTANSNATLGGSTIGVAGGSIPVSIIQPVLATTYLISMYGVYPSRN